MFDGVDRAGLRGHVVDTTPDGAADHIERLSQRYTGGPYQNYGGRTGGRARRVGGRQAGCVNRWARSRLPRDLGRALS